MDEILELLRILLWDYPLLLKWTRFLAQLILGMRDYLRVILWAYLPLLSHMRSLAQIPMDDVWSIHLFCKAQ